MSGSVSLENALAMIQSEKSDERRTGLQDLKYLLSLWQRAEPVNRSDHVSTRRIFEILVGVASSERLTFTATQKKSSRELNSSRLSLAAATLRLAVDVHVESIQTKLVKFIVEHVLATASAVNGIGFCAPIIQDYIKCLLTLLEYRPHLEHLSKSLWADVVDFCLHAIGTWRFVQLASTGHQSVQRQDHKSIKGSLAPESVQGLLSCLRLLTGSPNSPLLERAELMLTCLLSFLKRDKISVAANQAALESINSILSRMSAHQACAVSRWLQKIIPLLAEIWLRKRPMTVRDQVLSILIHVERHVAFSTGQDLRDELIESIEIMSDVMLQELMDHGSKDLLDIDDICLELKTRYSLLEKPLQINGIALGKPTQRAERQWTTLYLASFMAHWLDCVSAEEYAKDDKSGIHPPKRRRKSQNLREILQQISVGQFKNRVGLLQLLTFYLHHWKLDIKDVDEILTLLIHYSKNDHDYIPSWALLAISCCAFQKSSSLGQLSCKWLTAWEIALRLLPSSRHSRAACYVLNALLVTKRVSYPDVSDSVERMLAGIHLQGPAVVADSSLEALNTILKFRAESNTNLINISGYEQFLGWLFQNWKPSNLENRAYASECSKHVSARVVIIALSSVIPGNWPILTSNTFLCVGDLGRAMLRQLSLWDFHTYMLALDDHSKLYSYAFETPRIQSMDMTSNSIDFVNRLNDLIVDCLLHEVEKLGCAWQSLSRGIVTAEVIRVAFTFSFVSLIVCSNQLQVSGKAEKTFSLSMSILDSVLQHICRSEALTEFQQVIVDVVAPLLHTSSSISRDGIVQWLQPLRPAFGMIAETLSTQKNSIAEWTEQGSSFHEDWVLNPNSQSRYQFLHDHSAIRYHWTHHGCAFSQRSSVMLYTKFLSQSRFDSGAERLHDTMLQQFIVDLMSLPPTTLLSASTFLRYLINTAEPSDLESIEFLTTSLGNKYLTCYEWERCETSLAICVDVISASAHIWMNSTTTALKDASLDIYSWFVDVAIGASIASPMVQITLAQLLIRLITIKSDMSENLSRPSIRTVLFGLLRDGELFVRYHIAKFLPQVIRCFNIDQHDHIFADIQSVLPHDIDWVEGIGLRLLVLSHIGSSCSTLLRKCVYHIFETAASVNNISRYASISVRKIVSALNIDNAQTLFKHFSSQILYTWLGSHNINSIPYCAFNYGGLKALIEHSQAEVLTIMIMRHKTEDLKALETILNKPINDLLLESFSRVVACAFAIDISTSNLEGISSRATEILVNNLLGSKQFHSLLEERFPLIIGHMFLNVEHEESLEKILSKNADYRYALAAFKDMRSTGTLCETLPPIQQPSFKLKYLPAQLERLQRRLSDTSSGKFWSQFTIVVVIRMLLDNSRSVLGPLQTQRLIYRTKALISLAGRSCLSGYPLEMILQGLIQCITNDEFFEEAVGIIRYLIKKGHAHLKANPGYAIGISLVIIFTMNGFTKSSSRNPGHEYAPIVTAVDTCAFSSWLCDFLDEHIRADLRSDLVESYSRLIRAVKSLSSPNGPSQGASEVVVLSELLDQLIGKDNFLVGTFAEKCFCLFLSQSSESQLPRDESLRHCDDMLYRLKAIWKSCQLRGVSAKYLSWAACTLGRAFARNGELPRLYTTIAGEFSDELHLSNTHYFNPQAAIWKLLNAALSEDIDLAVGLAEKTIQIILQNLSHNDRKLARDFLPNSVFEAFALDTKFSWEDEPFEDLPHMNQDLESCFQGVDYDSFAVWIKNISIALASSKADDPILQPLPKLMFLAPSLSERLYPYVLQIVLLRGTAIDDSTRSVISSAYQYCFENATSRMLPHLNCLLRSLLYLRTQPKPGEVTTFERNTWLSIDYVKASVAAMSCDMFKVALLFLEINDSLIRYDPNPPCDASSVLPTDLLMSILSHIPEPDSFYGIEQATDFASIARKFEVEGNDVQKLLLAGAQVDSLSCTGAHQTDTFSDVMIESLTALNMNMISRMLITMRPSAEWSDSIANSMTQAALKLRQWDLKIDLSLKSTSTILYTTFQQISQAEHINTVFSSLHTGIQTIFNEIMSEKNSEVFCKNAFQALAVLTRFKDILSIENNLELQRFFSSAQQQELWILNNTSRSTRSYLNSMAIIPSIISSNQCIQKHLKMRFQDALRLHAEALLYLSSTLRESGAIQESLSNVVYLSNMKKTLTASGVVVDAALQNESSSVLWEIGELAASVKILKDLLHGSEMDNQTVSIARSDVLATLGQRVSHARLEPADKVLERYLVPALKELGNISKGSMAGRVFHEYALYCYNQLQSSESIEEFHRSQNFVRQRKLDIQELEDALKVCKSTHEKQTLRSAREKAKQWLSIEERELSRLKHGREVFLVQCLQNYLKSLAAWDKFDGDIIAFLAAWLQHSDDPCANNAVATLILTVQTKKFVRLMNQLASRIQDNKSDFQEILHKLLQRLCNDHPYHAMHHVFAGSKASGGYDPQAISRNTAALKIGFRLKENSQISRIWASIYRSDDLYNKFAQLKSKDMKQGVTSLKRFDEARRIERDVPNLGVPPITSTIAIREDLDYTNIQIIVCFKPELIIPSGISVPKILTVVTSTGSSLKQLFKGGADDLRQDAIMEQVFAQATLLLDHYKLTRQRQLKIRTYNVVPLDSTSGAIEFVQPTISLHEFLTAAHEKYHRTDLSWKTCRDRIQSAQDLDLSSRIKVFSEIKPRFRPVLRHFFFERFSEPDLWFERRLSYTRSTAAISILGHILGLGDRHCQNILLDTSTGDVIHIDLGVAFEAGRVLPKPELIPFRLTRDIVDGFGLLGTEGVFRRCCEFTLEALRESSGIIMTLLNVLRYDPLHHWTISPIRAKRLQSERNNQIDQIVRTGGQRLHASAQDRQTATRGHFSGGSNVQPDNGRSESQTGEAERALDVVKKKLEPGLSVDATVSELIQQASDIRNLAVLFCGWAAFA